MYTYIVCSDILYNYLFNKEIWKIQIMENTVHRKSADYQGLKFLLHSSFISSQNAWL